MGGKFGTEAKLDYWTPGSLMLSDPGHFLYTMENYDKESLTEEIINKLKPYIENPNFQPSKVSLKRYLYTKSGFLQTRCYWKSLGLALRAVVT